MGRLSRQHCCLWSYARLVVRLFRKIVLFSGIIISVCLSLVWIIKDSSFPSTGVLGRLPGTKVFRSVNSFAEAEEIPQVKILQFDAPLNFSNCSHFEKKIIQLVKLDKESLERKEHRSLTLDGSNLDVKMVNTIRVIIIDASSITRIDVTAIRMLESVSAPFVSSFSSLFTGGL